jgi:hypothetical protein
MFNTSDIFGTMVFGLTNSVTGDIYLTLLTIMIIILLFFLALRIPVEISVILILPLLIVFMADGSGDWRAISGIAVLYLSLMFGKYFLK